MKFLTTFCFLMFLSLAEELIGYLAARHADAIIRRGRRVQDRLGLPRWMRVVSDTREPGMSTRNVKRVASALAIAAFFSLLGLLIVAAGSMWYNLADSLTSSWVPLLCVTAISQTPAVVVIIVAWVELAWTRERPVVDEHEESEFGFTGLDGWYRDLENMEHGTVEAKSSVDEVNAFQSCASSGL